MDKESVDGISLLCPDFPLLLVFIKVLACFFLGTFLFEKGGLVAFDSDIGPCQ